MDIEGMICRNLDAVGRTEATALTAFTTVALGFVAFSPMPASPNRRSSTGFISPCGSSI
jgi:hypothetical protein